MPPSDTPVATENFSVLFINQIGTGFPEQIEVAPGTTLSDFLDKQTDKAADDLMIRVRQRGQTSQAEPAAYTLQPGDRISATIVKQEGGYSPLLLAALILAG